MLFVRNGLPSKGQSVAEENPYVSRGGLKLAAALSGLSVDPADKVCADLGCSVGGFTDCLLQRGAKHIYAVDTAYGTLAWTLRNDDRVTVLERTNALHFDPAAVDGFSGCDLVVFDLGWTRQRHAIATALRWLKDSPDARIIALIKPHYEAPKQAVRRHGQRGVLSEAEAADVLQETLEAMPVLGVRVIDTIASPIRGGGKRGKAGNIEYLSLLMRE